MKCVYCPNQVQSGYICEECIARCSAMAAVAEKKARKIPCRSCPAGIGEACTTGSGSPRGIAHATRKSAAERISNGR